MTELLSMSEKSEENLSGDDEAPTSQPATIELFCIPMSRNVAYFLIEFLCLVGAIITLIEVFSIEWETYSWRFYVLGFAFFLFVIVTAEVNRQHLFARITAICHSWRYLVIATFLFFAVIDFVLLELSDVPSGGAADGCDWDDPTNQAECPLLNPDENGVRYMTRGLTIFCGALFCFCVLGYWEQVSYFAAHSDWIIAMLYMTIIGGVFVYFSRCLQPPSDGNERKFNWSWHQSHDQNSVVSKIVTLMILVVVFFVCMGAIVLALFGDAAESSGGLGSLPAIIIFTIISMIIMITPLAPGSVVDLAAGFLFVTLFVVNEGMTVPGAFALALAMTIALHFIGSCTQYYVGKIRAAQIWMNHALPPELLAASDSVLKTANWAKVGIVGQIFMDTANGLNQGRMDMAFCTQFWSEYASIPNAISLVSAGALLAIPSFDESISSGYGWATDALPLVVMIALLWQMMGSSWGAKELLQSAHTASYWTALEKWVTVQYFWNIGYVPTKTGWENDVYQLGDPKNDQDDSNKTSLFTKVQNFHPKPKEHGKITTETISKYCAKLFAEPTNPKKQKNKMIEAKKFSNKVNLIRQEHFDLVEPLLEGYVKDGWVSPVEKDDPVIGLFQHSEGSMLIANWIFGILIYLTGIGCYYYISRPISLEDAVVDGIKVLNQVEIYGWISFIIFWILVIIYFNREFLSSMQSLGSTFKFLVTGLKIDSSWETVFNTPDWSRGNNNSKIEIVESTDNSAHEGIDPDTN